MQRSPGSNGRSIGAALAAIVVGAALGAACSRPSSSGSAITGAELVARMQSGKAPVVLDVRSPAEYAAGHIPGAINIPYDQVLQRLGEIPAKQSDEIVVHCRSGGRAGKAESALADAGYTRVRDLEGHMNAWSQAGMPLEQGAEP